MFLTLSREYCLRDMDSKRATPAMGSNNQQVTLVKHALLNSYVQRLYLVRMKQLFSFSHMRWHSWNIICKHAPFILQYWFQACRTLHNGFRLRIRSIMIEKCANRAGHYSTAVAYIVLDLTVVDAPVTVNPLGIRFYRTKRGPDNPYQSYPNGSFGTGFVRLNNP